MNYDKGKHENIRLRISMADKQTIAQAAKRRGIGLSEFVRAAAARAAGIAS